MPRLALMVALLTIGSNAIAADPPKLELKDGDRIVYLGNTFAEQDQSYGYLETLLTIRHPNINFTFRNLGWSGDTVWGDARARFGTRADGFNHLKDHVLALKPTVILVAYGMNESFAGEAGLPEFEKGLNTLLDTLAETKARIVLISPIPHEKKPTPLPDPAAHNADLRKYRDAIGRIAKSRGADYLDIFDAIARLNTTGNDRLTDDGIHPTERGYALISVYLGGKLVGSGGRRELTIDKDGALIASQGWNVEGFSQSDGVAKFSAVASTLPWPTVPPKTPAERPTMGMGLILAGFGPGPHDVKIDGRPTTKFQPSKGDPAMSLIFTGPENDQVEKLRALINKKNELYFHRWRPQNETYLFGFRKHEQGNNAIEIPQFDPLVAELEAQINTLKKPVKHTYEIVREKDAK